MKAKVFILSTFLFNLLLLSFPHAIQAAVGCSKTGSGGSCAEVDTAIGAISTNLGSLVGTILQIIIGLGGGVAVLLIIAAGYQMMTSQGNPEKVKEARERLTSAIVGLLFIFFSLTILQIIGVDILHLPGFSR